MSSPLNLEKKIGPAAGLLFLLAAFVLLYQPWMLGMRELFRLEGFYAAQTLEIDWRMPLATAHGVAIKNAYPLYPLLSSLLVKVTGLPVEFAMRLLSVGMTGLVAVLIYVTARLSRSAVAAQCATAMFIGSNIIFEKALDAYPTSTIALGLLSAQLLWFYFGVRKSNWDAAWLTSFAVLAPTFYAGGFSVLLYFLLPLVFMRRPLTVWPKLRRTSFYLAMVILALAILAWGWPYISKSEHLPIQYWQLGNATFLDYLEQLVSVPFDCIVRFLPWTLIAWVPFCVALQDLDYTPIFSRYLRIIVISDFFLLWLLPDTDSYELFYLAGPLALLTGLHYEAAVRRYSKQVRLMLKLCGIFTIVIAVICLLFCLLPQSLMMKFVSISHPIDFRHSPHYVAVALALAAGGLLAGMVIMTGSKRNPVWALLLTTSICMALFYWIVIYPYRIQDQSKHRFGNDLRRALETGGSGRGQLPEVIYKSNILDLYGECRYLGIPVRKINDLPELPGDKDVVYLLTTDFPQYPLRNWSNLLPSDYTYLKHRINLWRGELRQKAPLNPKTDW